MPTLAHALLAALKDYDAHEIFGIPGDLVLPLSKVRDARFRREADPCLELRYRLLAYQERSFGDTTAFGAF
jgi:hypothetical protein